jgi:hypothetical protein
MTELLEFAKELAAKSDEEIAELHQNRFSLSKDKRACLEYELQQRNSLNQSNMNDNRKAVVTGVDKAHRRKIWLTVVGALISGAVALWSILSKSCQ